MSTTRLHRESCSAVLSSSTAFMNCAIVSLREMMRFWSFMQSDLWLFWKGTIATNNQFLRTTSPQQFASSSPLRNCIFKRTPRESKFLEIAERVKNWGSTSNSMCLKLCRGILDKSVSKFLSKEENWIRRGELKSWKFYQKVCNYSGF